MPNKYTLVTGGAGYIGSHVLKQLLESNYQNIIVIDNLSTGNQSTLDTLTKINDFIFIEEDLKNNDKIEDIFKKYDIDTIIHFAASIVVPESISNPLKYYLNNTINTTSLVSLAIKHNVKKFIFSSTAAVYGEPQLENSKLKLGINEEYIPNPINPYGMSKLMSENIIKDTAKANDTFKYVIFRYFNVAGSDTNTDNTTAEPRIGQSFPNATHLIKIASQCATNSRDKMYIYGIDYPTDDGTCIRDYIHVDDLANAHILAIDYLDNNYSDIFNIGYGKGYSVKKVIDTMKKVTNSDFTVIEDKKREGDPSILISNNNKIKTKMNWKPKFDNLELICNSAYKWERTYNYEK